ncbi:hypothetical protein M409DRAFT_29189 [Zasmidium cellare ATCC 36951]|uniref:Major facilitator superfamily (MFS) profile domain-containing protein n=1 Tax=Zasmidium cellare ATCC 36951 TaxID=1080233 RepID=A0A6A6C3L5_ZASCE|nr:uncharacterized protein M409DRAFT_29189 [Zasmidium cellare ATCC 36951]KAF2160339.1 hypothetical protein M409DRAFT_29189 [Zasmidium cellare ATCC 36951]
MSSIEATQAAPDSEKAAVITTSSPDPNQLHVVSRGSETTKHLEDIDGQIVGFDASLMAARTALSGEEEKRLLRRLDWRILPLMALMYVVKNIDQSNMSNVLVMNRGTPRNILQDLHMTSNQFNLVNVAYYVPYIIAEAPSNLLLKYFRPSVWLSRIMVTWGFMLCLHAVVSNAGGLFTVRALLGLFEAGLWPGLLLQLCYWYRPDETPKRVVIITVCGNFSPVVGSALAYAFNGVAARGMAGWKWLVLTEGVFTIVLGIAVFFLLPDFPANAKWLSDKEKAFLQARLPSNSPRDMEKNFSWKQFVQTIKDHNLWLFLVTWSLFTIGTAGLHFYQPTVIANLGFTTLAQVQLLNMPPSVFACIVTVFGGWLASTTYVPLPIVPIIWMLIIEACYAVQYVYPNVGGVYAATVIAGGFRSAWETTMWPWRFQTLSGATGSAFALALVNSYGQIGAAIGPHIFNSRFAPRYTTSFAIGMGFVGLSILMAAVTWWVTYRVEVDTRILRRARLAARQRNETVLDDVDLNADKKVR